MLILVLIALMGCLESHAMLNSMMSGQVKLNQSKAVQIKPVKIIKATQIETFVSEDLIICFKIVNRTFCGTMETPPRKCEQRSMMNIARTMKSTHRYM